MQPKTGRREMQIRQLTGILVFSAVSAACDVVRGCHDLAILQQSISHGILGARKHAAVQTTRRCTGLRLDAAKKQPLACWTPAQCAPERTISSATRGMREIVIHKWRQTFLVCKYSQRPVDQDLTMHNRELGFDLHWSVDLHWSLQVLKG